MKMTLGFMGAVIAAIAVTIFVGFAVSNALIFINFSGPDSVVEPCFEIGFAFGLACGLGAGFLIARHFWIQYSSPHPA